VNEWQAEDGDQIHLLPLIAGVLRARWIIIGWALVVGALTAFIVSGRPILYLGHSTFLPHGSESGPSRLASLAGQFGVSLPAEAGAEQPPAFYVTLLTSRRLLTDLVTDTYQIEEMDGEEKTFFELYEFTEGTDAQNIEKGVDKLQKIITTRLDPGTRIVTVSLATQWPSFSLALINNLLDGINDFNRITAQAKALHEREFIDERLALIRSQIDESEAQMTAFLLNNRQFARAPSLEFEHDRINRVISMRQLILESLMQTQEELRVREVRETPAFTIVEPPRVPTAPEPRGRVSSVLLGLLAGGFIGLAQVLIPLLLNQTREQGERNEGLEEILEVFTEMKQGILKFVPGMTRRGEAL
jgi:uncharacterized protein involved in exopolysaccharide biosynthesis